MAQRNELNVRAAAVGFDSSTITNDSKLEQKLVWLEKNSYSVTGTVSTTTLTTTGGFSNDETLTLGGRVYTFRLSLTTVPAANQILIGSASVTLDNLKDAINGTALTTTPGVGYNAATVRNVQLTAGVKTATTLVISATDTNAAGLIATTETCANASLTATTLTGGVLGSITQNVGTTSGIAGLSGDRNTSL